MKLKLLTWTVVCGWQLAACNEGPPGWTELPASYDGPLVDSSSSDDLTGYSNVASAEWTFQASQVEDAEVEFDLDADRVKQFSTMRELSTIAGVSYEQINRAQKVEVFKQGSDQQFNSEFFKQNENDDAQGLLDVLVVIDNSGSMEEEQQNLSSKLLPLLTYVSESDWKIAVVTTDMSDGCLRDVISKNQQNPQSAFAAAIRAGVNGSGIEAGVPQAVRALDPACMGGQSWLRPNSTLAVLIVSDEDNCSDGTRCANPAHNTAGYLLDYLAGIRQVGVNAKVFGLVWHESQSQRQCRTGYRRALIYSDLIDATGGTWGSICDSDYSATLQAMSMDLSLILKTQFALEYTPNLGDLEVFVNEQRVLSGFRVLGNVLEFEEAPAAGARISVNYKYATAVPSKDFTLREAADSASIQVYLDGQAIQNFTYDEGQRKLSFDTAPQVREVKVTYRLNSKLQSVFNAELGLDGDDIEVYQDGQRLDSSLYTYDSGTGEVRFATAPTDGAKVKIQYPKVLGPQLEYPLFAADGSASNLVVFDTNGTIIPVSLEGQWIRFSGADFVKGKEFIIEYDNPLKDDSLLNLGFPIYGDSLKVVGDLSGPCDQVSVTEGSLVDLNSCTFAGNEKVLFSFKYVKSHLNEFELDSEDYNLEELLSSNYNFSVTINGQSSESFEFDGSIIRITEDLEIGATVTVKLFLAREI